MENSAFNEPIFIHPPAYLQIAFTIYDVIYSEMETVN